MCGHKDNIEDHVNDDLDKKEVDEMFLHCKVTLTGEAWNTARDRVVAKLCKGRDDIRQLLREIMQEHKVATNSQADDLSRGEIFEEEFEVSKPGDPGICSEKDKEDLVEDYELEKDVYNVLLVSKNFSGAQITSFAVISMQLYVLWLIFSDLCDDPLRPASEEDENRFNIPFTIDKRVAIAQAIAIIFALVTQEDLLASIEAMVMVHYSSRTQQGLPAKGWWYITNFLRWSEGFLTLMVSFTIVGQATGVLDIFMNFAAVGFVSGLDNVFYTLGATGYFGERIREATEQVASIVLTRRRGRRHTRLARIALIGNLVALFIGWGVVRYNQKDGTYIEAASCASIRVVLPDIEYKHGSGKDTVLKYSYFSGRYRAVLDRDHRPRYVEMLDETMNDYKAEFYYCSEAMAWHFTITALADSIPESTAVNSCDEGWLLQSPLTDEYFLENVPMQDWNVISGIGVMTKADLVSLRCGECSTISDCSLNGVCEESGDCSCDDEWEGASCQWEGPLCSELTLVNYGTSAESFRLISVARTSNSTTEASSQLYQLHDRPVYIDYACDRESGSCAAFYSGQRWYWAEIKGEVEDFLQGLHAYWSDYTIIFYSEITDQEVPTGLQLISSSGTAGAVTKFECTDVVCSEDACNGFQCITGVSAAFPSPCHCTGGSGGLFCEYPKLSEYSLNLFCQYCYKRSAVVLGIDYFKLYWASDVKDICGGYTRVDLQNICPTDLLEDPKLPSDMCTETPNLIPNTLQKRSTNASEILHLLPQCGTARATSSKGVLYRFMGQGRRMKVSTCTPGTAFDTQISVFRGTCDALECVEGNNNFCGSQSQVTWEARLNIQYYILVYGRNVDDFGDFQITASLSNEPVAVSHKLCDVSNQYDPLVNFLTPAALGGKVLDVPSCGSSVASLDSDALVYRYEGDGAVKKASTCGASVDTQLSVFVGNCSTFTFSCVTGNNDACGRQSIVHWFAKLGVEYYLVITARTYGEGGGPFALLNADRRETNFDCESAIEVQFGITRYSFLDGARPIFPNPCGSAFADNSVSTAVYYVTGTGTTLVASTSLIGTNPQLAIFAGSCDDLQCIAGEGNEVDAASVEWFGQVGVRYTVFVYGKGGAVGHSGLSLDIKEGFSNFDCESAYQVEMNATLIGSLLNGIPTIRPPMCGSAAAYSDGRYSTAVYSFVGDGRSVKVSTVNDATTFYTQMSVVAGNCTHPVCITGNDYSPDIPDLSTSRGSSVEWFAERGISYTIFVFGSELERRGKFMLTVSEGRMHENYNCEHSFQVNYNTTTEGYIAGSPPIAPILCGVGHAGSNLWGASFYSVVGDGAWVKVLMCGAAGFELLVTVECSEQRCIDEPYLDSVGDCTDTYSESASTVKWFANSDVQYTVIVYAPLRETGSFKLKVDKLLVEEHTNYDCASAVQVEMNSTNIGLLGGSAPIVLPSCDYAGISSGNRAAVYTFLGAGTAVVTSTCGDQNYNGANVSASFGDCTGLVCVGFNILLPGCSQQSSVAWFAEIGVRYTIFVFRGKYERDEFGPFRLTVAPARTHSNYNCESAVPIGINTTISSFIGVSPLISPACSDPFSTLKVNAAVYTIVGEGTMLTASTCGVGGGPAKLSVLARHCRRSICSDVSRSPDLDESLEFDDDPGCGLGDDFSWFAEMGANYVIYVYGTGQAPFGDFELTVEA